MNVCMFLLEAGQVVVGGGGEAATAINQCKVNFAQQCKTK